METYIVWAIVGVVALLTARSLYRLLSGKSDGCGCACSGCGASDEECGKDTPTDTDGNGNIPGRS